MAEASLSSSGSTCSARPGAGSSDAWRASSGPVTRTTLDVEDFEAMIDEAPYEVVADPPAYVNLADLELRLNDEPKRRRALEAARGLARNDEISRRVNDLLKAFGGRAEITARPTPAEKP